MTPAVYAWQEFAHSAAGSRYQYIVAGTHYQYEPATVYQLARDLHFEN